MAMFFFSWCATTRGLHAFPTRRSSDLEMNGWEATRALKADPALAHIPVVAITAHAMVGDGDDRDRSEEHTSELQSPYDIVCRLLLEKKKHAIGYRVEPDCRHK